MPIKRKEQLLGAILSATPGTDYSNWVNTDNYKDFIFVVRARAADWTSSDIGDTVTFWIEVSDTDEAGQHYSRRRALTLTKASDASLATQMTTITGNLSLPVEPASYTATALRQQWDYKSPNVDEYVRLGWTTVGNPELLGTIYVDMYVNQET